MTSRPLSVHRSFAAALLLLAALPCAAGTADAAAHREAFETALREADAARADGDVERAAGLYRQAIERARAFGETNLRRGRAVEALADLYREQGRYDEAEPLYLEAVATWERLLGAGQPHVATSLHNLAATYLGMGRHDEAEPLLARAISIWERHGSRYAAQLAVSLEAAAALLQRTGRRDEAAPLLERARTLRESRAP